MIIIYSHFAKNPEDVTEKLLRTIGTGTVNKWKEYPIRDEKKKAYQKELFELKSKYGIDD